MKLFIQSLSVCTVLLFFATLFSCQLYTSEVDAAKRVGQSYSCSINGKDKKAFVTINPCKRGATYNITISWSGGSWTDTKYSNTGNTIHGEYHLGRDHKSYTVTVSSPNDKKATFQVGFSN